MLKKTLKQILGNRAEKHALKLLEQSGLKLLVRNYNTRYGEIDLIMQDQDTLVFVEVRYRKNNNYGGAAASVTHQKQQKIIKTAQYYQQKNAPNHPMRFDVVTIEGDNSDNEKINWIQSAFDGF